MITVIAGTNRPHSKTEIIAKYYYEFLQENTEEKVNYYSLQELPVDIISAEMYQEDGQHKGIAKIQDAILTPAKKWVLVMPEYNGSYPGILKLFMDAVSVRNYAETFKLKKMALIGVASGRAGNLRGIDQMTNAVNYLGFTVFSQKLPIPLVKSKTNELEITDDFTKDALQTHASAFLNF